MATVVPAGIVVSEVISVVPLDEPSEQTETLDQPSAATASKRTSDVPVGQPAVGTRLIVPVGVGVGAGTGAGAPGDEIVVSEQPTSAIAAALASASERRLAAIFIR